MVIFCVRMLVARVSTISAYKIDKNTDYMSSSYFNCVSKASQQWGNSGTLQLEDLKKLVSTF